MALKIQQSNTLSEDELVVFVSAEVRKARMTTCNVCEHIKQVPLVNYKKCEVCGCIMDLKTTFKMSKCPKDKWGTSDSTYVKEPA